MESAAVIISSNYIMYEKSRLTYYFCNIVCLIPTNAVHWFKGDGTIVVIILISVHLNSSTLFCGQLHMYLLRAKVSPE